MEGLGQKKGERKIKNQHTVSSLGSHVEFALFFSMSGLFSSGMWTLVVEVTEKRSHGGLQRMSRTAKDMLQPQKPMFQRPTGPSGSFS